MLARIRHFIYIVAGYGGVHYLTPPPPSVWPHLFSGAGHETRSSADADNGLDAFNGQSRSTNMVPFHMLRIVSYCAIVTLSLRRAIFTIFVFKKFHDLEMGSKVTQGH